MAVRQQYTAWDLTGTPSVQFSPDLQQQLMAGVAEVDTGSTDSSWMQTEVKQNYFQADVTKLFEAGWLDSIQFGAKYRDGKVHRNTGNTYWVCPGLDPSDYDNNRYQAGCDPTAGDAQPGFFLSNPISNITGAFNANVFPGINYPAYIDYLNKTYGGSHNRTEEDFVYDVNEKIYSGYFQANFRTERVRGNIGVRVVRTKQFAQSSDSVERFNDYFVDNASGAPMSCDDPAADPNLRCQGGFVRLPDPQVRDKVYALSSLEKTYTDVLPSFNIAWDITDNLVLRGAASKVVARPLHIAIPVACATSAKNANDRRVTGGTRRLVRLGQQQGAGTVQGGPVRPGPGVVLQAGRGRRCFAVPQERGQLHRAGGARPADERRRAVGHRAEVRDPGQWPRWRVAGRGTVWPVRSTSDWACRPTTPTTTPTWPRSCWMARKSAPRRWSAVPRTRPTLRCSENDKFLARASYNRRGEVVGGLNNGMTTYTSLTASLT